jgi:DNA adenine methylase
VSLALQRSRAILKTRDYKEILLENVAQGDFIYLDPPYNPISSTAKFTSYTSTGFNSRDQQELAKIFRTLTDRKCMVVLSNSDTPEIRELYSDPDYSIEEINVLRSINSNASKRVGRRELLIRNFKLDQCVLDAYNQ